MIEKIQIAKVATFGETPEVMDSLSTFNYFYGPNGSGKTTLSRLLATPSDLRFAECSVTWGGSTPQQVLVYNRDFVTKNFSESTEIKGIFTLGEMQADTLKKIEDTKNEIDALTKAIAALNVNLQGDNGTGGKNGELAALEESVKEQIWEQKKKHESTLAGPLSGFLNSKDKFKAKVLQERTTNKASVLQLSELITKANTLFGSDPTEEQTVKPIDGAALVAHESNAVLKKRVIGKDDVDIAAMIKKLNNSDWVREGKTFYEANENVCPFCQQSTTEGFAKSLNEYFDEAFVADSKAIEKLVGDYSTDADRVQQQLAAVIALPSRFLDVEKLKAEKALFDSRITVNKQRLAQKKKEPSQLVDLESVANVLASIAAIVDAANTQVTTHNTMVKNLARERATLTAQAWKYIVEVELTAALAVYDTKKDALTKAIEGIKKKIGDSNTDKLKKEAELRSLEKSTTSIQPTINAINGLLKSFGFRGFSLAMTANGKCYKVVRTDGKDAKETLSEGERTFITFLYFYHLLKGSESDSGITTDRVVVIDDPVSSLDSDILFVVSSLIKGLLDDVRAAVGHIKQVFVLTHNVYFHKEITFNPKRNNGKLKEETFWVIRKPDLLSKAERHEVNPIKTSYELLWSEVRRADRSKLTIQNTLRRILENYFKILGGIDPDTLCSYFDGKEKLICKSLASWVNDGSHNAHDDLFVSVDDAMVGAYLEVFKRIFEKTGQLPHYNMMMGIPEAEAAAKGAAA